MANEILVHLLATVKDAEGKPLYCCIKQWLIAHRHVKTGKLSAAWGVSKSTIKHWRHRLRVGDLPCEKLPTCKMSQAVIKIQEASKAA